MKNSDFQITDHRVKGHADLGTFVSYHDIANQTGDVYEVTITEPGAAFRVINGGAYGITFKLP